MEFTKAKIALEKEQQRLDAIEADITKALDPEKVLSYPTGAYFLQREKYLRFLKDKRSEQKIKVQFAKANLRERLRALNESMVELKKMEKSRDREFERWQIEFNRFEQRENDEIASAQSFYRESHAAI